MAENDKKKLLAHHFTEIKLHERLERLERENLRFLSEIKDLKENARMEVNIRENTIDLLTKERNELLNEKKELTEKLEESEIKITKQFNEIQEHQSKSHNILDKTKSQYEEKIKALELKLEQINHFIKMKADLETEKQMLVELLEGQKKANLVLAAEKDKEKLIATDKLKNEMMMQISETKTNLLVLKKEQLDTTTRLTVLQNHQLTTELEYQSKQTEKLLFKNSKLSEQVQILKRDMEIHKQVEHELAKKYHNAQKVIQELTKRNTDLETLNESIQQSKENSHSKILQDDKTRDEILQIQEKKIEKMSLNISKLENDNQIIQNDNKIMMEKLQGKQTKRLNLANFLVDYLENLQKANEESEGSNLSINLLEMNQKDLFSTQEKEALITILLEQIKPLLSRKTLQIPDSKNVTINIIDEIPKKLLPKIKSEYSMSNSGGSMDFQKMNRDFVPLDIRQKLGYNKIKEWSRLPTNKYNSSAQLGVLKNYL